jgi:ketosteroid isomerase-like protein
MAEGVKEQVGEVVSQAKRRVGLEQPSAADDDGRVGIVRGAWRAFGEGDFDSFIDVLRDDVQWEGPSGNGFPGGASIDGRDGIKSGFVEDIGRTYTSFGFRPESFLDADDADAVVVIGRFQGEGVEGASLDEEAVQVWEFKGNTVARVRVFVDSDPFPPVVTERQIGEWEQEDKEKEQEEKKSEDEKADEKKAEQSDDDSDSDSDDDDSPKASSENGSDGDSSSKDEERETEKSS